jgi:hypothetical protein
MAAPVLEVRHSPDSQEREGRPTRQSKIDGPLGRAPAWPWLMRKPRSLAGGMNGICTQRGAPSAGGVRQRFFAGHLQRHLPGEGRALCHYPNEVVALLRLHHTQRHVLGIQYVVGAVPGHPALLMRHQVDTTHRRPGLLSSTSVHERHVLYPRKPRSILVRSQQQRNHPDFPGSIPRSQPVNLGFRKRPHPGILLLRSLPGTQ